MVTLGPVTALLAVGGATAVVLRDVMAYDRPPRSAHPPAPLPEPTAPPPPLPPDGSMLAAITTTESDEHSTFKRVNALAMLLMLTLLAAIVVGAGIYRAVSALK